MAVRRSQSGRPVLRRRRPGGRGAERAEKDVSYERAARLDLPRDASLETIVENYVEDHL